MNFKDKKDGSRELKPNILRSPNGKDEVSVIRHSHCNTDYCRFKLKSIENLAANRSYWGFFVLLACEVRNVESDLVYSPHHFKQHADIVHNYVEVTGQPLPNDVQIRIQKLMDIAKSRIKEDDIYGFHWNRPLM